MRAGAGRCPDCGEGQDPSSDGTCQLWRQGGSRCLDGTLTLRSAADGLGLASAERRLGTREEQGRRGGPRPAASWNLLCRRCGVGMSPGAWRYGFRCGSASGCSASYPRSWCVFLGQRAAWP